MNALTAQAEQAGAVTDYAGGLLSVIERAARDPSVDIDKMERLLAMQERVQERNSKAAFTEAKIAMRAELPEISARGRIIVRGKVNGKREGEIIQDTPFARFEDIHDAVMPVLARHGFDLSYRNGLSPDGKVRVTTILSHVGGHTEETMFDLPHDSSGSKNSVQAVGSSTSYGKRYGTLSILNIKVAGEDDDGQAASYKDSRGEPLARTKLDGPHTSKSALKQAVQAIRNQVRDCVDVKTLNELLKASKDTIDQAARDWTALLDGDPEIPEDVGLKGDVENRRAYLRENGGMFAALLKSMQEMDNLSALQRWRTANEQVVDALDGAEARAFQKAWDALEGDLTPSILAAG
jgi:hypothetical protein